jgi:hypothetical protein
MATEKTFAAKLAAFMLNGLDYNYVLKCKKEGGFDASSQEVLGMLPFAHMNISKSGFTKILTANNGNMLKAMSQLCKAKNFDKVLQKVDFKCQAQSSKAVEILIERIVDSIESAYETRRNGKKHARELAAHMRWQAKNKIIPESSIKWCEGIRSAGKVQPV